MSERQTLNVERRCATCGRSIHTGGRASQRQHRCLICRTAEQFRGWHYTPDPYAVVAYRQDEAAWERRGERE